MLDVFADRVDRTAWAPATRLPARLGERFDLEWDNARRTGGFFSREMNRYEAFEEQRRAFLAAGRSVLNPYALPDGPDQGDISDDEAAAFPGAGRVATRGTAIRQWNQVAGELRAASPDGPERFFTAEEIERQADQRAVAARRRAAEAEDAGGGIGGEVGAILGQMAGMLTDPVQAATLPLGAPAAWVTGGLARRMLVVGASEAAINAGVQAATQYIAVNPYAREAGFEPDPAEAVLYAALLGGGIGAALPLAVAGARRLFRSDPQLGTAARVTEDAARIEATTPPGMSIEAHAATLARAEAAVARGTVPADLDQHMVWQRTGGGQAAAGGEAQVFTPAGRAVRVRYGLVEADRLVASHQDDLKPNPIYPHDEGLQPRDRSTPMSAEQIQQIVSRFQPERLAPNSEAGSGPPIVDSAGIVESGNGRVLALRRILTDGAYAKQRDAWLEFLKAQGFDPTGMRNPVLVARRVTPLSAEERRAFAREANQPAQAQMTAPETARADAAAVADAIHLYTGGALDLAANSQFVARFLKSLPQTVRSGLQTADGRVSQDGLRRMRAAVLAHAYGDQLGPLLARFVEGDTKGLASIANALQDVAAPWSAMRAAARKGEIAPGMDITADLVQAVETVDLARRQGVRVPELLAQADLARPPLTDNGRAMLLSFFTDGTLMRQASRQTIADRLRGYIDEAMKQQPGENLFGAPPVTAGEVLAATGRRVAVEAAEETPVRPAGAAGEAPAPAAEVPAPTAAAPARAAAAVDPAAARQQAIRDATAEVEAAQKLSETEKATLLEAQRLAAAEDFAVPVGTGDDIAVIGAREALDMAEAGVVAAERQAKCLIGAAGVAA